MNVSFDWDHTLATPKVQKLAETLKYMGFNIFIITSRYDTKTAVEKFGEKRISNQPIFDFAKKINVPKESIIFTNMKDKAEFFKKNKNFIFHLDDDEVEVDLINQNTMVLGILKEDNNMQWWDTIMEIIKHYK